MNSQDRSSKGRGGFIWADKRVGNAYSVWSSMHTHQEPSNELGYPCICRHVERLFLVSLTEIFFSFFELKTIMREDVNKRKATVLHKTVPQRV